jgi:pimeloyl-ACP methyl ester carboxylesterase
MGPEDGTPVFFLHGNPGSRSQVPPSTDALHEHGIKLIALDRPGIGGSSQKKNRTLADVSSDVRELADALGIDRFAVVGLSAGGAYAVKVADSLPERVTRLVLVSSDSPHDREGAKDDLGKANKVPAFLAEHARPLLRAYCAFFGLLTRKPDLVVKLLDSALSESDKALLQSDPAFKDAMLKTVVETGQQGSRALYEETLAQFRPWGIDLKSVRPKTDVWHGDADPLVPFGNGAYLAKTIPNATLHSITGAGHLLFAGHWNEILASLKS